MQTTRFLRGFQAAFWFSGSLFIRFQQILAQFHQRLAQHLHFVAGQSRVPENPRADAAFVALCPACVGEAHDDLPLVFFAAFAFDEALLFQLFQQRREGIGGEKQAFAELVDGLPVLLRQRDQRNPLGVGQPQNLCQIEHTRHRSEYGFLLNLISGLAAYCLFPYKPQMFRRGGLIGG